MITWKHIFSFAHAMLGAKQTDIADCLDVNRAAISRLINGKTKSFSVSYTDVYKKLFNPENDKSLANKQNTKFLLDILKDEIKKSNLSDSIDNMHDDNYEQFVMKLLRMAEQNQAKVATEKKEKESNHITPKKKTHQKVPNTQSTQLIYECYQSFDDYAIWDFINTNLNLLTPDRIRDAITFIGHIDHNYKQKVMTEKKNVYNKIFDNVFDFIAILWNYLIILRKNSINSDFPDNFKLDNDIDEALKKEANNYRLQLESLSHSIKKDFEKELNEEHQKLRAAQRFKWDENTQKADFENYTIPKH